jgi:hypothetical protein
MKPGLLRPGFFYWDWPGTNLQGLWPCHERPLIWKRVVPNRCLLLAWVVVMSAYDPIADIARYLAMERRTVGNRGSINSGKWDFCYTDQKL